LLIDVQGEQLLQISKEGSFLLPSAMQFKALAIILAVVVLPTPLIPVNKKACASLPLLRALLKVFTRVSCPISSLKSFGLYLRAKTL
jgi:hypothetical protein